MIEFGRILVSEKIITPRQLQKALDAQKSDPGRGKLGAICIQMGFCDVDDVARALACKSRMQLEKRTETQSAMTAFREAIAKSKKATQDHLLNRIHLSPQP